MAQYATLFSDEVEENPVVQDDGYTSLFADEAKEIAPVSQDAAQGASGPYASDGYDSLFSDEANLAGGGGDATAQRQPVYDGRYVGNAGAPMRPEDFAGEDSMGGMELLALRGQADGAPVAERADGSVSAWLKNLSLGVAHNSSGRVASRNIEMNLQDILRGTVRKDGKDVPLTELPDSELDYLVDAAGWNGAGAWFKRFLGPWARSDSGVMQEWDRTEGAKIEDPSERKAARVRYAQEMARNITLQNERDKQAAQAELQGREQQPQAGFTAGLVQTGSYMLPFMIPGAHGVMAGLIGGLDRGQEMASDSYEMDENGNVRVAAERDSTGAAIAKGVARGIVEPLVETVGGTLATKALGGLAGATLGKIPLLKSVGGKIAETAVGKALSRYGKTMQRFGRATGLQGAPEETIEEFEDNILDAALGIDRRESEKQGGALQRAGEAAKEFFKPESLKNLAESMLLVQILGGGIAHVNDRYRSKPIDNILAESAGIDKGVLKDYTADEKWAAYEAYVNGLTEDEVKEKLGKGANAVNELADVIARGTAEVDDFRDAAYAMMDAGGTRPKNNLADAQMRVADAQKERQYAEEMAAPFARADAEEAEMGARIERQGEAMRRNAAAAQEQADYDRMMEEREEARAQNRAGAPQEPAGARGETGAADVPPASPDAPEGAEAALEGAQSEPPPPEVVDRPNRLRRQQPNDFRHPGDNRLHPAVPEINQQPIRETKDETGSGTDEELPQQAAQDAGRDGRQPPPQAAEGPVETQPPGVEAPDAGAVEPSAQDVRQAEAEPTVDSPAFRRWLATKKGKVASAAMLRQFRHLRSQGKIDADGNPVPTEAQRAARERNAENLRGYSYEDYGAPPDVTRPGEGGTGDRMGAALLRFAQDNGGILKKPPKGAPDPLADWIANFKDGGGRGDSIALFGMRPRKGSNDAIAEDMPSPLKEYVEGMIERDGPEAVADWFLKTRRRYAEWAAGRRGAAREAREAAKVRAEEDAVYDYEGMSAARDGADAEWDGAIGEIEAGDPMFGATSEYVKPFSRENLRNAKQGDIIHFDHDAHSFALDAYDDAKGEMALIDERDGARRRFKVSKSGIREIVDGRRNEEVPDKDNAGDAGGGRRPAAGAPGEAAGGERGGGGGFALESATSEELRREERHRREKEEIKRRQEAPLETGRGEAGSGQTLLDLGGAEGEDLFSRTQRTDSNRLRNAAGEDPLAARAQPARKEGSSTAAPSAGNEAPKRYRVNSQTFTEIEESQPFSDVNLPTAARMFAGASEKTIAGSIEIAKKQAKADGTAKLLYLPRSYTKRRISFQIEDVGKSSPIDWGSGRLLSGETAPVLLVKPDGSVSFVKIAERHFDRVRGIAEQNGFEFGLEGYLREIGGKDFELVANRENGRAELSYTDGEDADGMPVRKRISTDKEDASAAIKDLMAKAEDVASRATSENDADTSKSDVAALTAKAQALAKEYAALPDVEKVSQKGRDLEQRIIEAWDAVDAAERAENAPVAAPKETGATTPPEAAKPAEGAIIGIRRTDAAKSSPAAPTPEMRRKATAAMRILGADAGKDAAALEAELRRMEERGQAASGPGRRKAEALRDLAAYKRAVGTKEVPAEEIAEGRQRDAERRIIEGEGERLPSEGFYGRRQSRDGAQDVPVKWADEAKKPLERVARALRNVVTVGGKKLKVSFADRPEDVDGQSRKSIGGIFTGTAADYANRSRQGGVDDGPSVKHIGTGEGSQVYGWGLYGSTVRGVAEGYANPSGKLSDVLVNGERHKAVGVYADVADFLKSGDTENFIKDTKNALDEMQHVLDDSGETSVQYGFRRIDQRYIDNRRANLEEAQRIINDGATLARPGNLYEQTFFTNRAPGDESHLLKWYEPVSEEQKHWIKTQAEKEGIIVSGLVRNLRDGGYLYERLTSIEYFGSPKAASEFLARAGIDGIKYPVDSYGGKGVKDGDKAGWNYVAFSDEHIRVDHKWTDGQMRYMRNGDGEVVGEYDAAKGEIRLYPGATVADVVHEFTHPLVDVARAEANAGRGELLGKIKQIIDAERATWEKPIRDAYADKGEGEILEEIFTHAMGDKGARLFGKSTNTLEGRRWYNRLWDAIKGLWQDFATKMGWNKADLRGLDGMSPEAAAQKILSEMAKGRSFGDAVTGGEGTRNAVVRKGVSAAEDAAYLDAVNRGDMKTAAKMVEGWLKEQGFSAPVSIAVHAEDAVDGQRQYSLRTMPTELAQEIAKWKTRSKSPYSNSYYNATDITWDHKPDRSLRVSDHWNFWSRGQEHCVTDRPVENGAKWVLAEYHAEDGKYHVLKEYDAVDGNRTTRQLEQASDAYYKKAIRSLIGQEVSGAGFKSGILKGVEQRADGGEDAVIEVRPSGKTIREFAPNVVRATNMDNRDPWRGAKLKKGAADYKVALNPTTGDVKSAEPATYDDAGNVIPLSQRFNPQREDIRYSRRVSPPGGNSGDATLFSSTSPVDVNEKETFAQKVQRKLQDYRAVIKRTEEKLGITDKGRSLYYALDRVFGKTRDEAHRLAKGKVEPMLRKLVEAGAAMGKRFDATGGAEVGLDDYLYAMHAKERNDVLASRPDARVSVDGSGMSEAKAQSILSAFAAMPEAKRKAIEDAAQTVWDINDSRLDRLVESGRMSQDEADGLRRTYRHYVPLRTDMEAMGEDLFNTGTSGWSKSEFRRALGRTTEADSPTVFSLMQAEDAIAGANKNEARQRLYDMVTEHPELGRIRRMDKLTRKWSYTHGEEAWVADERYNERDRDDIVMVKRGGTLYAIELDGALGKRLAAAVTSRNLARFPDELSIIPKATRTMAEMRTQLVPTFLLRNMKADHLEVFLNSIGDMGFMGASRFLGRTERHFVSADAHKAIQQYFTTGNVDTSTDAGRLFDEYVKTGSLIGGGNRQGYADTATELNDIIDDMVRGKANPRRWGKAAKECVSTLNEHIETGTRFGVYWTCREMGMSPEEAASYSRDLTTNFNRKGEWTPVTNSLFMFSNAAIQGLARASKAMNPKLSPHGYQSLITIGAIGVMGALWRHFLGSDDDRRRKGEGDPSFDTDYDKANYIRFGAGGLSLNLKERYPWAAVKYAAEKLTEFALGDCTRAELVKGLGENVVGAMLQEPFGHGGTAAQTVAPSVLVPVVQMLEGKDFRGEDLYARKFDDSKPDSSNGKRSTAGTYKGIAAGVNWLTGGNEHRQGGIDLAPETVKTVAETIGGGVWTDATRVATLFEKAYESIRNGKNEFELRDLPFVGDLVKRHRGPESQYYEAVEAYDRDKYELKNTRDPARWRELRKARPYLSVKQSNMDKLIERVKDYGRIERGQRKMNGRWVDSPGITTRQKEQARKSRLQLQAYVLRQLTGRK